MSHRDDDPYGPLQLHAAARIAVAAAGAAVAVWLAAALIAHVVKEVLW